MTDPLNYDQQLEAILIKIIRDYNLPLLPKGWRQPGDLKTPLPDFVQQILRCAVLVMVADKHGLIAETKTKALQECARLFGSLYEYLRVQLYSTQSLRPLDASVYEADHFLVVVLAGDVAPVIEVMGEVVLPFVIAHHNQPGPNYRTLLHLADVVIQKLYADPQQPLRDAIMDHVEPMLSMRLRPLPLHIPDAAPIEPSPAQGQGGGPPAPPASDGKPKSAEAAVAASRPDPEPANPKAPPAKPSNEQDEPTPRRRKIMRAPLPYWEIKGRDDQK